jgi:hypothetical protein
LAVGLQPVQQSSNLGLRQQELGVILRIGKEGGIKVFQRGVAAEREICFAFRFCLNDEIVNLIPLFPASDKITDERLEINDSECRHTGQFNRSLATVEIRRYHKHALFIAGIKQPSRGREHFAVRRHNRCARLTPIFCGL